MEEAEANQKQTLLKQWWYRANINQQAHYLAGLRFAWLNRFLGIPTVILTAIVGTAVFASLTEGQVSPEWQIAAGLLSILATVLAALQTFLGYSERAANHRRASAEFGAIRREIEQVQASNRSNRSLPSKPRQGLRSVRTRRTG
jgi:hypothetical protein